MTESDAKKNYRVQENETTKSTKNTKNKGREKA
jgi:hypothetical protein